MGSLPPTRALPYSPWHGSSLSEPRWAFSFPTPPLPTSAFTAPCTHSQVKPGADDGIPPTRSSQGLPSFPPSLAPISWPGPWGRRLLSLCARPSPRRRTCSDLLSRFPGFCRRCWPRCGKQLWGSSELPITASWGQLQLGGWNGAGPLWRPQWTRAPVRTP